MSSDQYKPQRGVFGEPRDSTRSVAKAVEKGGAITLETLGRLCRLLDEKTDYPHHIEVSVTTGAIVKTIDNERDALETIRRLEARGAKNPTVTPVLTEAGPETP